jgi:hypothetical protein
MERTQKLSEINIEDMTRREGLKKLSDLIKLKKDKDIEDPQDVTQIYSRLDKIEADLTLLITTLQTEYLPKVNSFENWSKIIDKDIKDIKKELGMV